MKQLRVIRIFLATLFFVATLAYLCIGPQVHPMAVAAPSVQILLSAISLSIGATLIWFLLTFLLGRVYCSTVCPIGTLTDLFARLGRRLPFLRGSRPYSWQPARKPGTPLLILYVLALLLGISMVPFLIEPWNIMRNICSLIRPDAVDDTWIRLGVGAVAGMIAGGFSFLLVAVWSAYRGREFCTMLCPVGTALRAASVTPLMHIEIDPDYCIDCGLCEDVCSAGCIKVLSRYVDNSRCLRCFDCLAVCPNDAIRYQLNHNVPLTPLFRKKIKT